MTFKNVSNGGNCYGCTWVSAEGEITTETPKLLRDFIEADEIGNSASIEKIYINSSGGDLRASLELGRLFRSLKAEIHVYASKPCSPSTPNGLIGQFA